MAVLKCWQDRGTYTGPTNFDPEEFLAKLQERTYAWERLRGQLSARDWIQPRQLLATVRQRFGFLQALTEEEILLCQDRWKQHPQRFQSIWEGCRPSPK